MNKKGISKLSSKSVILDIFKGDQFTNSDSNLLGLNVKGKYVFMVVRALAENEVYRLLRFFRVKSMIATDDTYGDIHIKMEKIKI